MKQKLLKMRYKLLNIKNGLPEESKREIDSVIDMVDELRKEIKS